jgi:[ribosomal protein S5]-alanine N-acetyltransferase
LIPTERLELVAATPDLVRAALAGARALAESLGAVVPETWPPEYLDTAALEFTLTRLTTVADEAGWWMYFVVRPAGKTPDRRLVGTAGYAGPPSPDGTVEIGYGIVSDERRQGYATEAAEGLVRRAFAMPAVRRIIAETYPHLEPSIGVLRKCGFSAASEPGSAPGVIRFELKRASD